MKQLSKKQKQVLFVGIFLLLVVIIGGGILLFAKPKNEDPDDSILDNHPIEEVAPDQAEDMYSTLTSECSGALVWDLGVGETVTIDNLADTNACHTDNYYSKMIGYTYNDVGVVLHVNVLKRVENNLYKIDDTLVGPYDDAIIDASLDNGTTYEYVFEKKDDNYQLVSVKLMEVIDTSETPEEVTE